MKTKIVMTASALLLGLSGIVNPPSDFVLESGDDAIVVAESLGTLAPLKLSDLHATPGTLAPAPTASRA